MEWLSQNWLLIVFLVVGGYFLMTRMGMGRFGMGHAHGHGGHMGTSQDAAGRDAAGPDKLIDPVSQHALSAETAIASVHQGRIYYFEDRANRDAFEANPGKYLSAAPASGREIQAKPTHAEHRGHGCC